MAPGLMAKKEFDYDKQKNFSEWYNAIIYATDLVDIRYNVQGFLVHKPWSMIAIKKMYGLFEGELEKRGHQPCLFPTVIPEDNFEIEKEHAEGFSPEVFWITQQGDKPLARKLALRPTSETAMYPLYALWIKSKSDLPLKMYQSCSVFRNESETNPFMRGREFLWIEAHDVFETKEGALSQIDDDIQVAENGLGTLGIPFMVFVRPQWDKFAGAVNTYAFDTRMPDGKAFQISTTHDLGSNFAKAFGVQYANEAGEKQYCSQTTFGIGIWRILGAVVSLHGDNKGLRWPWQIAPIQVVLVPIVRDGATKPIEYAKEIAAELTKAGIRCQVDSSEKTPGFKYNYWEMKGIPLRIEVGGKEVEEGSATIARRDNNEKTKARREEVVKTVLELSAKYQAALKESAQAQIAQAIKECKTKEEIVKAIEQGLYAKTTFCSIEMDGKPCADVLQSESKGGKVRGILYGKNEVVPSGSKCVVCGKPAKHVVYVARQY